MKDKIHKVKKKKQNLNNKLVLGIIGVLLLFLGLGFLLFNLFNKGENEKLIDVSGEYPNTGIYIKSDIYCELPENFDYENLSLDEIFLNGCGEKEEPPVFLKAHKDLETYLGPNGTAYNYERAGNLSETMSFYVHVDVFSNKFHDVEEDNYKVFLDIVNVYSWQWYSRNNFVHIASFPSEYNKNLDRGLFVYRKWLGNNQEDVKITPKENRPNIILNPTHYLAISYFEENGYKIIYGLENITRDLPKIPEDAEEEKDFFDYPVDAISQVTIGEYQYTLVFNDLEVWKYRYTPQEGTNLIYKTSLINFIYDRLRFLDNRNTPSGLPDRPDPILYYNKSVDGVAQVMIDGFLYTSIVQDNRVVQFKSQLDENYNITSSSINISWTFEEWKEHINPN